jgi:CheY-like chemotaxis protein
VAVLVEKKSDSDGELELCFTVRDTGAGIPPEARRNLFQPFSQADSSMTRRYGGAGLGLAICAQIVELMRGAIDLESEPGRGSTFWFTARFRACTGDPASEPRARDFVRAKRVLIADASATDAAFLRMQLAAWGAECAVARAGGDALNALRGAAGESPFDSAIIALELEDMDGLELARRITGQPDLGRIALLLTHPFGRGPAPADLRSAGFSAGLSKPFRQSHLAGALAGALGRGKSGGDPTRAVAGASEPHAPVTAPVVPSGTAPRVNLRLLLVEDHPVNQKVAMRMLERLGYRADAVANGREALEALRLTSYDLVLLDCQMPEMDGYETARQIRRRFADRPHLPIIGVTAHALDGDREKCLAAGMDDYLAKPFLPEQLNELVNRWLGERASSDPAPPDHFEGAAPAEAAVDLSQLELFRGSEANGSENLLVDIIDCFVADLNSRLAAMRESVTRGEAVALARTAHALKGSAGSLGAAGLVAICAQIERAVREGSTGETHTLLQRLEAEAARVSGALEQLRRAEVERLSSSGPKRRTINCA